MRRLSKYVNCSVPRQKQKGAVLSVGLLMLVVMTLLSVTGLNSSIMNEQIASNAFVNAKSLQSAESASFYSLGMNDWVGEAIRHRKNSSYQPTNYSVDLGDSHATSNVSLTAMEVLGMGSTIRVDSGIAKILLQTAGSASVNSGTSVSVTQGFYRLGPS